MGLTEIHEINSLALSKITIPFEKMKMDLSKYVPRSVLKNSENSFVRIRMKYLKRMIKVE